MEAGGATAFSSDTSSQFQDVNPEKKTLNPTSEDKLEWTYDIEATVKWIVDNGFKRVSLQFPDSLLVDAVTISSCIEKHCRVKPYILGDTSYGSCCVDEVAAQHILAECVIHYGEACLSQPPEHLPVKYVFPRHVLDTQDLLQPINDFTSKIEPESLIVVVSELALIHVSDNLVRTVREKCQPKNCTVFEAKPLIPSNDDPTTVDSSKILLGRYLVTESGEIVDHISDTFVTLFIAADPANTVDSSPFLTLWMLGNPNSTINFYWDTVTQNLTLADLNVNRLLRKRLFLIEKLKDAQVVGIVAGTLGVRGHVHIIDRLQKLCRAAGKKTYIFSVGKLNSAKLANFATDIDLFVLVSCPFGVLLDYSDFFRPILSPFEVEMAFNSGDKGWCADSGWYADFNKISLETKAEGQDQQVSESGDEGGWDMSLITGKMRIPVHPSGSQGQQQLIAYNPGDYFRGRTWKGLEEGVGEEIPVEEATEGRKGIAAGYDRENIQ